MCGLVSVSRIPGFPKVAPVTIAVRAVVDVTYKDGETQRQIDDYIDLVQDRSMIAFNGHTGYSDRVAARADAIEIAKLLAERAKRRRRCSTSR